MSKISVQNTSVIILGAGNSERMGFPKLFLPWNKDSTFIEHIIHQYCEMGFVDIVVVVNSETIKQTDFVNKSKLDNARIIINLNPEKGRIHSVKLAFSNLNNKNCLIQNVDNPFVNKSLLLEILEYYDENAYVVPFFEGKGGHPILISSRIAEYIEEINDTNQKLNDILHKFKRIEVITYDSNVLVNINTFEDYQKYLPALNNFNDKV